VSAVTGGLDQRQPWPLTAPGGPSLLGRRPELLPIGSVASAWVFLLVNAHLGGVHAAHVDIVGVPVMTIATMGLLAVPVVRTAAASTLWWRSGRAAAVAFVVFLGAWIAVAATLHAVAGRMVSSEHARMVTAGLLVVSALLQLHPRRIALVKRCGLARRIRPFGWPVTTDCASLGLVAAGRCARLCAVPMAAMLTAPASLGLMAGIAAATLADRVCGGRRAPAMAAGYAVLAAAALVW
jgi:hypothetical protein